MHTALMVGPASKAAALEGVVPVVPSQSDWARVDAMTDEELIANALADPETPPLEDDFFEKARRVRLEDLLPATKERVSIRLDRDVLAWFRSRQQKGYQTATNAVLRAFIESQERGKWG